MIGNPLELLAPAGNMKSFFAAIFAGADAVYLGGTKFGARAYADNFSDEELCAAISYAHLFNKKVYLTLNTLLKDSELDQVIPYLKPLYEEGLDGIIVQDFGVCRLLKEVFPKMELHASTQMTVTGSEGANLLKQYGFTRIVPARELSFAEIKQIKKNMKIEIETFVHGAMCYAYSGQCLFSSMLGHRSGNRGRCAGPCRLPYDVILNGRQLNSKNEQYLLSLKDLCTISLIPQLIEAGIDSFKIEGRMKSPEYVAGVTSIYRKYIDVYIELRQKGKENNFKVSTDDLRQLESLYIRSGIETGYYEKHNGASLVTLTKPCYETGTEEEMEQIRRKYIDRKLTHQIEGCCIMKKNQPASFVINLSHSNTKVCVEGDIVAEAKKRPLDDETIIRQLTKTGNTYFEFGDLKLDKDDHIFYSIKALNDLRRKALDTLMDQLLQPYRRSFHA